MENPYAVQELGPQLSDDSVLKGIAVRGKQLLAAKRAELPHRCVFTNQSTRWLHRATEALVWSGRAKAFRLTTKTCRINFSVCQSIRYRMLQTTVAGGLIIAGAVFLRFSSLSGAIALAIAVSMLTIGALLAWKANAPSLRIVDYEDGRFVIEGCCDEFLQELASELGYPYESPLGGSTLKPTDACIQDTPSDQ